MGQAGTDNVDYIERGEALRRESRALTEEVVDLRYRIEDLDAQAEGGFINTTVRDARSAELKRRLQTRESLLHGIEADIEKWIAGAVESLGYQRTLEVLLDAVRAQVEHALPF